MDTTTVHNLTSVNPASYVSTPVVQYHDTWAFVIAILFLIIGFAMIITIVLYYLYWKPMTPATACENNNNCGVSEICQAGFCVQRTCASNADCNGNGTCVNSYCTTFSCQNGNDCLIQGTGTACVNGSCIPVGASCVSNANCSDLSCMNQVCVQCLSNSSCPVGQGCFDRACRFPYVGETGANMINYPSPAQANGNIMAAPGFLCSSTTCGTTAGTGPISCSGTGDTCPNSCPFCVNTVCRCTAGQVTESCRSNMDCASGVCVDTASGRRCIAAGGECTSNYNGMTGILDLRTCPVSRPYCVNGLCSNVSLGAICGATGMPPDLCSNPAALGVIGPTGITPNGMGFFCVNGTCQQEPGTLNDQCTPGSCAFISNTELVCTSVITPGIPEMRCLRQ